MRQIDAIQRRWHLGLWSDLFRAAGRIPLNPINLPLIKEPQFTDANNGMFGVRLDAGPDARGQRLTNNMHSTRPKNPIELLVAGSGWLSFVFSQQ